MNIISAKSAAIIAALIGVGILATTPATQAAWPERPVTIIIPWSAGGGTDATGRIVASMLEKEFGQPFPVVNRTGGGGVVGHTAIANAAADGYTIGVITTELSMYKWQGLTDISYRDVTPIYQYNSDAPGLLVRADSPHKNAKDLLDAIRANPGKLKASGANQGGLLHLAMVGMLKSAGIDPMSVTWIPSQGGAQGLALLTSSGSDFATNNIADARALIGADKVRPLATMDTKRKPGFDDVPTLEEATGLNWTIANWRGIGGPKGIPQEVIDALVPAIEKICRSQEFGEFMEKRGYGVICLGPQAFAESLQAKEQQFGDALQAAGLAK